LRKTQKVSQEIWLIAWQKKTRNVGDTENNIKNTAISCDKAQAMLNTNGFFFFHIHTVHLDIIKVLFIHQLMH